MRVLVDRHHAGLLYSLQLLFEDRLGLELYVPVGYDWWTEKIWRFGEVFGDTRLADQYLRVQHPWEEGEFWHTTRDTEYPEREIRGVTLEQFKALGDWQFVVATVQENQHGFDRLARETGATSVYQVGNTAQRVDWSLQPRALVSSEVPIPDGARAVRYHQEFDKDGLFAAAAPPADIRAAASFVNCFDRMPQQWATFCELEGILPGWNLRVHGADGRDGRLQPTSVLAERMRDFAWGWHDKPQGDGFGHVIHYWASLGRPLIGTRGHYQGRMAEAFWRDNVTAVTFDGKTFPEIARQLEEIVNEPERYARMAVNIRETLDELVDFDAEEVAIREVLGL